MPTLIDLHFGGGQDALPSVAFSGVDVVPIITGQLNAAEDGSQLSLGEYIAIGIGSALVIGGGVCAAICGDSHHHHGGEGGAEGGET